MKNISTWSASKRHLVADMEVGKRRSLVAKIKRGRFCSYSAGGGTKHPILLSIKWLTCFLIRLVASFVHPMTSSHLTAFPQVTLAIAVLFVVRVFPCDKATYRLFLFCLDIWWENAVGTTVDLWSSTSWRWWGGTHVQDCLHFAVYLQSFQPTGMEIARAQNVLDGTRMVYGDFPI